MTIIAVHIGDSLALIVAFCIGCCHGLLTVQPNDTVALVGHSTYFNCSTSNSSEKIHWYHWYHNEYQFVYAGGKVYNPYAERFRVEIVEKSGSYNLVIANVTAQDVGQYRCWDLNALGQKAEAQLTVLASYPVCKSDMNPAGVFGPNSCNLEAEDIRLSCSVRYDGNIPPLLHWTKHGGTSYISNGTLCRNIAKEVECNLTVKADLHHDGSNYTCQIGKTVDSQYSCSSGQIKVLYALNTFHLIGKPQNEVVTCYANSSQPCRYKWISYEKNESISEFNNQSVETSNRTGILRCEAECPIRGKPCTISAILVHVESDKTGSSTSPSESENKTLLPEKSKGSVENGDFAKQHAVTIALCVLCFLLLIALIVVSVLLKRKRAKRREETQNSGEEMQPMNHGENISRDETDYSPSHNHVSDLGSIDQQKIEELQRKLEQKETELNTEKNDKQRVQTERDILQKENEESIRQVEELKRQQEESNNEWSEKLAKSCKDKEKMFEDFKKAMENQKRRKTQLGEMLYEPLRPSVPPDLRMESSKIIETGATGKPGERLEVCGLTVLGNQLFVVFDKSPMLEIHNLETLTFNSEKVKDLVDPGDITGCEKYNCIYIADWKSRNIKNEIMVIDRNGEITKKWTTKDDECRLSITQESNLLVTYYHNHKLIEYKSSGEITDSGEISLRKAEVWYPYHAVKLTNGHFVVCHGKKEEAIHRVCIVDDDGCLLKSFGGEKGRESGQVDFPINLALTQDGFILVGDQRNRRVLLLSRLLEFQGIFLWKKDDQRVLRILRTLCLDHSGGRLFVVDCNPKFVDSRVLLFDIVAETSTQGDS